jgi:hypothetical protein
MKLKKIVLFLATATLLNAGWFNHDKEYYLSHPNEAKEKRNECEKSLAHALIDNDKDKINAIQSNQECKDAKSAYIQHRKTQYQVKQKIEKQQRAKEMAKKKKVFEKEYQAKLTLFKQSDFKSFMAFKKECQYFSSGGIFGEDYSPKAAKCQAWKELQKDKEQKELTTILSQYPDEQLLDYKNQVCKNAIYGDITCDFAQKAYEKRKKQIVDYYISHKDKLKQDFNECYHKIDKLNKSSKYKESQKVRDSYKCFMASQGALKFNIYGYFQPIK